jgi:hypothetical protein
MPKHMLPNFRTFNHQTLQNPKGRPSDDANYHGNLKTYIRVGSNIVANKVIK